jgi:glycosyltransferase involved in cell wall biosynthesis
VRWYFSNIDYFLSVGDANEAYYKYYGVPANKLIRMRFPIDVQLYESAFAKKEALAQQLRDQYGLHNGNKVISVVGKMNFSKRQGDIIESLGLLEKKGYHLDLFIVGSGEMEEAWKIKAKALEQSRVFFTGFIGPETLPAYYAVSDIYVHPASADAHSLAISEALYMGCPAIVSDQCGSYGPTDDVQEGKSGYVFQCENIGDLAQKMEWLLQDEQKRISLATYAHSLGVQFQRRAHGEFVSELIGSV